MKSYAPDSAKVIRDGKLEKINARDLVPGDLIEISVGDKIPADSRLIEIIGTGLRVDQAILTGESVSVQKYSDKIVKKESAVVKQDQVNLLFSGTTVTMGRARAVVVLTGAQTAIGEIQKHLSEVEEQKTPLKQRLDDFGDQLAKVISVICVLVWIVNIRHFSDPEHGGLLRGAIYYLKIAVALAVAAIPEGLAVIITTCLALGTRKMAKKNAIVRSLSSVETLGCTSVICSDKTGTLTTNEMAVNKIYLESNKNGRVELFYFYVENNEFNVTGTSYSPFDGKVENLIKSERLNLFSAICSHCNNSTLTISTSGKYGKVGESTEAALKVLVEKIGEPVDEKFERIATLEFDRDRKSMSVIVKEKKSGKLFLFVKGAPETILMRSKEVDISYYDKIKEYGRDALRVLCIAYKELETEIPLNLLTDPSKYSEIETDLSPLGLVAMRDPPRPEIHDSIAKCRAAGIRVLVLTGDNQMTAEAICDQIGLFEDVEKVDKSVSMTGADFDELKDPLKALDNLRLLSRVEPRHKSRLVSLLQESGHVVAMTGDGVNDAPALKRADIGIAMGSGTDVARAASDIILIDDNFSTIVSAVQEGRSIYDNTKQFIRYLISSNIGEVACVLGTALVGLPEVLSPVQLLWVNLVTDGLPATALGFNPPSPGSMNLKPRGKNEPLVDGWLFVRYLIIGTYVGLATIGGFVWYLTTSSRGPHLTWSSLNSLTPESSIIASTVALSVLVVIEMANALNSLSENESLLCLGPQNNPILLAAIGLSLFLHYLIIYVPGLARIFGVAPLNKEEWLAVIGISLPVILIDEILKFVTRNTRKSSEKKKQE